MEYKLKNCNQKFENFIGCTRSIFVNQEPVMAVTLMSKTTGLSKENSKKLLTKLEPIYKNKAYKIRIIINLLDFSKICDIIK